MRSARIKLWLAALLALSSLGTPAVAQQNAKPSETIGKAARNPAAQQAIQVPPPEVLLILVRTTLAALNQANFTGNYTVLHGLGSPQLQAKNSAADLGNAFASLRSQGIDMSPVLVSTPQLTENAGFTPEGALRLAGFFPTTPLQIQFVMNFLPVNGRWRIDSLSVAAVPVQQVTAPASGTPAADANTKPASSKQE